jgi:hypothetical protein
MEELEKNKGDKFYPDHHMWTYCTFLGKYTDSNGQNYDLGIYEHPRLEGDYKYCEATVYGNENHEYLSGLLVVGLKSDDGGTTYERLRETYKRAIEKGLIN